MKTTPWLLLVVIPLTLFSREVKPGDGIDQVRNTLGAPRGQLHLGNRELWSFARGEVELTSGVVTRVALRSEAAQAAFETKRTAEVSQVREEQEIRRGQLTAEGEALKASKLADVSFQSASPRLQAEFWQNFAIKYPRVSCTEQRVAHCPERDPCHRSRWRTRSLTCRSVIRSPTQSPVGAARWLAHDERA